MALADIMAVVSAEYLPVKSRKQRLCMYEDDSWCTRVRNANRIDTVAQTLGFVFNDRIVRAIARHI